MKQLADTMAQDATPTPAWPNSLSPPPRHERRKADVPQAQEAARRASRADAARRLEKLSQQMRQAQRMLSEGRKPEPAGFHAHTGRMSQLAAFWRRLSHGPRRQTSAERLSTPSL